MRKPSSRLALLCALLAFTAGCETNKPRATSPSDAAPVGQAPQPVSAPDASTPAGDVQPTSPWGRARVGDKVTYDFSAHRAAQGGQKASGVAGKVTVEVVAVEAPWAWLTVSFAGDGGAPLKQPSLARSLVVPMRMDETRPLEARREGAESAEQPTAAGRTWEAKRYLNDRRPADGPLENRLYAVQPGPLYLTNGLLDASTTLSGFGGSGTAQLTLVEVRQGGAGAGAKPGLERPLGPGAFYEVRAETGGTAAGQRVCADAERGFVLTKMLPLPAEGGEKCGDFSGAEVTPLEETLMQLALGALDLQQWPPVPDGAAPLVRTTQEVGQGLKVNVVRVEVPEDAEGARQVRSKVYAADPWDTSLAGLPHQARFFEPFFNNLYRSGKGGKRDSVESTRLSDWGTWVPGAKP